MIGNNPLRSNFPMQYASNSNVARQIHEYSEMVTRRSQMGLEGDGFGDNSFAAKLKKADEFLKSGESCGADDSIGIILRQMDEPGAGGVITKEVYHDGVRVQVTKDALYGNSITIGGSSNPDWIQVSTSVGTVNIDLNDLDSLMKCLDMFSPEDINAILRKITEVRQTRDAMQEIDDLKNTPVEQAEQKDEDDE